MIRGHRPSGKQAKPRRSGNGFQASMVLPDGLFWCARLEADQRGVTLSAHLREIVRQHYDSQREAMRAPE